MIQYSETSLFDLSGRGVLDTRWSLSSGGHSADPVAGMTTEYVAGKNFQ
jgi:hypothetical protein